MEIIFESVEIVVRTVESNFAVNHCVMMDIHDNEDRSRVA